MNGFKLDDSPVPLYFQIASQLEMQIAAGTLPSGAKLRNERQLAIDYRVSLITVRAAMRLLVDKGLIVRHPGKGTFIASMPPKKRLWAIGSLDDLITTGRNSVLRLIWRRQLFPAPDIAQHFGLTTRNRIWSMRTSREVESEVFMLTDTYHPAWIANKLTRSDFTTIPARHKIVISVVEEVCDVTAAVLKQSMSVEAASPDAGRVLDIMPGGSVLTVEREYYTDRGVLLQLSRSNYRTDKYRYVMKVSVAKSVDRHLSLVRLANPDKVLGSA